MSRSTNSAHGGHGGNGGSSVRRVFDKLLFHEFLYALSFERLTCVEHALRIHGQAADASELSGIPPAVAELTDDVERGAIDDPDLLVLCVGDEEKLLLGIGRERDVPDRSARERRLRDES